MPDLGLLRRDLLAFSQAVEEPLEPWQAEAIQERAREIAIVGPRRSGKTRAAVLAAIHHCYSGPERHALVIASAEEGAKRFVAMARRIVTRSPLLKASVVDEQAQKLTFSNGSTLRCVAATDAAVRGITASLVIAEAALISDEVLQGAARPIIASEPDGRFLMISSALRASGAFYDAVRRGEAGRGTGPADPGKTLRRGHRRHSTTARNRPLPPHRISAQSAEKHGLAGLSRLRWRGLRAPYGTEGLRFES